jgi:thymidylate kinase
MIYEKEVWYPDVYIFLSKEPEKALEHIKKRKQSGDSGVSLDYLRELDKLYKKMIMNVPCKVHVINAHQEPEEIHQQILSLLKLDGVHVIDSGRSQVQETGSHQRQMLCTPFTNMCRLS